MSVSHLNWELPADGALAVLSPQRPQAGGARREGVCQMDSALPCLSHSVCSLIPQPSCLCPSVFLFSHSHFSLILSSVSHLHVSLWVCLSVSHVPSPSPAWPWHWKHTFVLWLHKKVYGISQAGDPSQSLPLPPAQPQFSSGLESSEPQNPHPVKL